MIQYLEQKDIDRKAWDACISNAVNSLPYAESWYLDIVAENWDALVLERNGSYEQVLPLVWKRKLGLRHIYSPFFCQQLGLFSQVPLKPNDLADFMKAVPRKFVRILMQVQGAQSLMIPGFQVEKKPNFVLDVNSDYRDISRAYSDNTKRNIKKAERADLKISSDWNAEEFMATLRHNQGKQIEELGEAEYQKIQLIIDSSLSTQKGNYLQVSSTDGFLAGIFVLQGVERLIYLFGTTNDNARQVGAMPFLFDHLIRRCCANEDDLSGGTLDFEGSSIPGLARFYRGFGAMEKPYFLLKRGI